MTETLQDILHARFGERLAVPAALEASPIAHGIANHRTIRHYRDEAVAPELVRALCAVALSAPSKSDMQQADIVIVQDPGQRAKLAALLPDNPWAAKAPAFLVFCGNNARQRQVHALRGHAFANDHLDAFFNPAVDAGIVLGTFIAAAEAIGMCTCPISAIRNHPAAVAEVLGLPAHVFPVAGLCLGWPAHNGAMSPRLGLAATVHLDRHGGTDVAGLIEEYDARRNLTRPYRDRRDDARFGAEVAYGWSEDKARQYAGPERQGWGDFVRAAGFKLE